MEGGADLLAMRTVQRLNPTFDPRPKLNEAIRDCGELARQPVATTIDRGEVRANYACGALFALVAEKANRGDFYAFVRGLVAANRNERELTAAEWYAALDRASGSRRQSATIRSLVETGSPDPKAAIATLLRDVGIAYTVNAKGEPQLQ